MNHSTFLDSSEDSTDFITTTFPTELERLETKPLASKPILNLALPTCRVETTAHPTLSDEKARKIQHFECVLSRVTDFLYLSSLVVANDYEKLRAAGITHVINCCYEYPERPFENRGLKYLGLSLKDNGAENVDFLFLETIDFIHKARQAGKRVLVHCHQGVSRSACIVIAYLMWANDLKYEDAYCHVRACRGVISPNTGFIFRLVSWWRTRHVDVHAAQLAAEVARQNRVYDLIPVEQGSALDSAIQDVKNSNLVRCPSPSEQHGRAPLFRLAAYNEHMSDLIVPKIVTPGTLLPSCRGRYALDERFIYLAILPSRIVILVGTKHDELFSAHAQRVRYQRGLDRCLLLLQTYYHYPSSTLRIHQSQLRSACSVITSRSSRKSRPLHRSLSLPDVMAPAPPVKTFMQNRCSMAINMSALQETAVAYEQYVTMAVVTFGALKMVPVMNHRRDVRQTFESNSILGDDHICVSDMYTCHPSVLDLEGAADQLQTTVLWDKNPNLDSDAQIVGACQTE